MKHIFISYSHQDLVYREALVAHLEILQTSGLIESWHDGQISPGEDWKITIESKIQEADIIVLLVSSDFLASKYCQDVELNRALNRWAKRHVTIIPILIRACAWEASALSRHQMLPSGSGPTPIAQWPHPDEAWTEVTRHIGQITAAQHRKVRPIRSRTVRELPSNQGSLAVRASTINHRLRYYCYISRSKIEQLYQQVSNAAVTGLNDELPQRDFSDTGGPFRHYSREMRYGGRGGDYARDQSPVEMLGKVLQHIERHEMVLDLEQLCREKAGVSLNAFCYTYRGKFYSLGEIGRSPHHGIVINGAALQRSRDDITLSKSLLIEPARTENALQEAGPNNGCIVSDICIICSEIEDFTIRLACSYKFFSDMGGHWNEHTHEWDVHWHSGNHHFFSGEVDTWFEALIFINGIRGNTILGTPLFLIHSQDPELRL